ncbi:MAG: peptidyl-prolyl cis-trans isomerase [Candidatus Eisenbacteria bacterium]
MSHVKQITLIAVMAVAVCLSCAQEEQTGALARVGNRVITEADLEARLEGMPPYMRDQLTTPEGKERLLKAIVEEEMIVREAIARGFDKSEKLKEELALRKRDILVRLFYEQVIEVQAAPADSDVVAYYEDNATEFTVPATARARHIQVATEAQALRIRKLLEDGADFGDLAREHSLDPLTKERDGVLHGEVVRGKPLKGLGDMPLLVEAIFNQEVGVVSMPVESGKGYHIILVDEITPETLKPLEEVTEDIKARLTYENRNAVRDRIMEDLRSKYGAKFLSESPEAALTPETLFKMASEESDPQKKIGYYRQFADKFPDDERVYEARFMIGFTMAEDLQDYDGAEEVFKEFLKEFPETDLSDDAGWMIENMRSGAQPEFGTD